MMQLKASNLKALQRVAGKPHLPSYSRHSKPENTIVHVGMGNFYRSHMAFYLDELLQKQQMEANDASGEKEKCSWGIVGAGVRPDHEPIYKALKDQDCLYTVIPRDTSTTGTHPMEPRVVGSIMDCLPYQENHEALYRQLIDPSTKVVSLTVTEGGYFLNNGKFDPHHASIQHDVSNPDSPTTVFGLIVKALKERRQTFQGDSAALTILSCDNIPENGEVTESVVVGLAKLMHGAEMADWIQTHVKFPNSMVDRITPSLTAEERETATQSAGYEDRAPVYCEPYRQWVLQDNFGQPRPPFELLKDPSENVRFVSDTTPFETMKIRILNGGHAALCYPAALLGLGFVHQAMEHITVAEFLNVLQTNEIIPSVPPVPETDLNGYWKVIQGRFHNATLRDSIARNCADGINRQPKFIVPVVADNLKHGRSVDGLALVSAMWCKFCLGKMESGAPIASRDPQFETLKERATIAIQEDSKIWLAMKHVYGETGENPIFQKAFDKALKLVSGKGVQAAMEHYIAASAHP